MLTPEQEWIEKAEALAIEGRRLSAQEEIVAPGNLITIWTDGHKCQVLTGEQADRLRAHIDLDRAKWVREVRALCWSGPTEAR